MAAIAVSSEAAAVAVARAHGVTRYAAWLGGAMMLFAALMVSADVLARRLFGLTMGGSDEIHALDRAGKLDPLLGL